MKTKSNPAKLILDHPDREQIISKLLMDISIADIHEWLSALYSSNKQLVISKKTLETFKDDHLDLYITIKKDLQAKYSKDQNPEEEIQLALQNNSEYKNKLQEYLDTELDIKSMLKKMIAKVEWRADQLFDQIQDDPANLKMDRNLIEFLNLLLQACEKYQPILEGGSTQTNIQNNINIQIVDQHIGVVYGAIREILAQIDYDASLLFIDLFTSKMQALKETTTPLSQEYRLETANVIVSEVQEKLEQ